MYGQRLPSRSGSSISQHIPSPRARSLPFFLLFSSARISHRGTVDSGVCFGCGVSCRKPFVSLSTENCKRPALLDRTLPGSVNQLGLDLLCSSNCSARRLANTVPTCSSPSFAEDVKNAFHKDQLRIEQPRFCFLFSLWFVRTFFLSFYFLLRQRIAVTEVSDFNLQAFSGSTTHLPNARTWSGFPRHRCGFPPTSLRAGSQRSHGDACAT